jgi:hypothetical protein
LGRIKIDWEEAYYRKYENKIEEKRKMPLCQELVPICNGLSAPARPVSVFWKLFTIEPTVRVPPFSSTSEGPGHQFSQSFVHPFSNLTFLWG